MLILSLFPGIGLLDRAFEQDGFCVVRGPDVLWGGDVKDFHPPASVFAGIIGGPPCQRYSSMARVTKHRYGEQALAEDLIPELERCVVEAQPDWFLMENVRFAPLPQAIGYAVKDTLLNARSFGSKQNRVRRFSFGVRGSQPVNLLRYLHIELLEPLEFEYAVLAGKSRGGTGMKLDKGGRPRRIATMQQRDAQNKRTIAEMAVLQGLPTNFLKHAPFTDNGKRTAIGNGVPLPMGKAIASAVKQAIQAIQAIP